MPVVHFPPVVRAVWFAPPRHVGDGWTSVQDLQEASKSRLCDTVGFLVVDGTDRIAVASSMDPSGTPRARGVTFISRKLLADDLMVLKPAEDVED